MCYIFSVENTHLQNPSKITRIFYFIKQPRAHKIIQFTVLTLDFVIFLRQKLKAWTYVTASFLTSRKAPCNASHPELHHLFSHRPVHIGKKLPHNPAVFRCSRSNSIASGQRRSEIPLSEWESPGIFVPLFLGHRKSKRRRLTRKESFRRKDVKWEKPWGSCRVHCCQKYWFVLWKFSSWRLWIKTKNSRHFSWKLNISVLRIYDFNWEIFN